jgi:hypothetical protein
LTIATIPARVASGKAGHAAMTIAKSWSISVELPESASESASRGEANPVFPEEFGNCSLPPGVLQAGFQPAFFVPSHISNL